MTFKLTTVEDIYNTYDYLRLDKLGFKFDCKRNELDRSKCYLKISDSEIELNTLEDFVKFVDSYGKVIVAGREIKLYDGYVE